ncbi:hypothetical protein [Rhodococcus sp. USK10]|uniref:hypothetical protein n=1 Tax=Rhodococcus sp. USK10 TaxID=2789739 RepID=UPI0021509ACA|nr:hypothetical protein [Rhodococcus sp. USK10]
MTSNLPSHAGFRHLHNFEESLHETAKSSHRGISVDAVDVGELQRFHWRQHRSGEWDVHE